MADDIVTSLDKMLEEICANIESYEVKASALLSQPDALLELRFEQYVLLCEATQRHKRVIEYLQGKPVTPQVHFAEAVLKPVLGGGIES